jgi:quercetin dioxygenase-like cupin family protein
MFASQLAVAALAVAFVPACTRDHAPPTASPVGSRPPTLTAATAAGGRAGAAEPHAHGTSIGATVKAPIIVSPHRLSWGEPPPMIPRGAQIAIIEGDPSTPNALFTLRAKLPANYRFMPHWHPTDEHVTVLSGTLLIGHGDTFSRGEMTELPAGGFAVLPAHHHHFASAADTETIIQIHAVGPLEFNYVHPADDPRNQTTVEQKPAPR